MYEILDRSLKHVRESLADLRPAAIGPDGVTGDLRHQAKEFARLYGIRVELSNVGTEDMLPQQQREVAAIQSVIIGVRDGDVDLTPVARASSLTAMDLVPIADIVIAPITIEPIAPASGEEGARQ